MEAMDRPKLMQTRQSDVDDEEDDEGPTVSQPTSQVSNKALLWQGKAKARQGRQKRDLQMSAVALATVRRGKPDLQLLCVGQVSCFLSRADQGIRDNSSHSAAQL
ncbi:uncharacterized protein UTRI_04104_B [Ustilago trichophora]|uniref:Uncharacterized protein n=1 Tax=Ustilago trichophora TaxID=86804 RepID=A0A5C3E8C1_9BASI|nr:uncharacterized protein UTRI_04104_B [Ustilago trichophora]